MNYKDTSWTVGDTTITIEEMEETMKHIGTIDIPITTIEHMCIHNNKTDITTLNRCNDVDLQFPIIIVEEDNEYTMILDGHHRLLKCMNNDIKFISAKVLHIGKSDNTYKMMFGK